MKTIDRLDSCFLALAEEGKEGEGANGWSEICSNAVESFTKAMDEDLNVSEGLAAIFGFVKAVNKHANNLSHEQKRAGREVLNGFDSVLGLQIELHGAASDASKELLDSEIQGLIDERTAARASKDFARADEIRDSLLEKGIELKDTPDGVKFKRL